MDFGVKGERIYNRTGKMLDVNNSKRKSLSGIFKKLKFGQKKIGIASSKVLDILILKMKLSLFVKRFSHVFLKIYRSSSSSSSETARKICHWTGKNKKNLKVHRVYFPQHLRY